jgi:hypothetical protein
MNSYTVQIGKKVQLLYDYDIAANPLVTGMGGEVFADQTLVNGIEALPQCQWYPSVKGVFYVAVRAEINSGGKQTVSDWSVPIQLTVVDSVSPPVVPKPAAPTNLRI